ncbi:MAG: ATP synthase F1 subunit delta [Bacilli bacterium]
MDSLFNRYALAFLALAIEKDKVSEYREEIKSLYEITKENPELVKFLSTTNIDSDEKKKFIDKNFVSYSSDTIDYLKVILDNNRCFYLKKILNETLFRFDDQLDIERGTIYSTVNLTIEDVNKIKDVLEKNIHKKLELKTKIDESLIGGVRVVLKDDIYDFTIKDRLVSLKETLLKGGE